MGIKKEEVNMLEGSVSKGIITIALPVMAMNVLQSMFNVIDMTTLKTFGSDELAVGAVGTCGMLIALMNGLLFGMSAGTNVVVAKYIGKAIDKTDESMI